MEKTKSLYAILGIHETASTFEIKIAYKQLCKEHHPDVGGDPERFIQINNAYKILSDPERRERYDTTGSTSQVNPIHNIIVQFYKTRVVPMITNMNKVDIDLISIIKNELDVIREEGNRIERRLKSSNEKLKNCLSRLSVKDEGENTLYDLLNDQVKQNDDQIKEVQEELTNLDSIEKDIERYHYEFTTNDLSGSIGNQAEIKFKKGIIEYTT